MAKSVLHVKKKSGKLQKFSAEKIIRSVTKAGSTKTLAKEIASKVKKKVYDKIPTLSIKRMVLKLLSRKSKKLAEGFRKFRKKKQ